MKKNLSLLLALSLLAGLVSCKQGGMDKPKDPKGYVPENIKLSSVLEKEDYLKVLAKVATNNKKINEIEAYSYTANNVLEYNIKTEATQKIKGDIYDGKIFIGEVEEQGTYTNGAVTTSQSKKGEARCFPAAVDGVFYNYNSVAEGKDIWEISYEFSLESFLRSGFLGTGSTLGIVDSSNRLIGTETLRSTKETKKMTDPLGREFLAKTYEYNYLIAELNTLGDPKLKSWVTKEVTSVNYDRDGFEVEQPIVINEMCVSCAVGYGERREYQKKDELIAFVPKSFVYDSNMIATTSLPTLDESGKVVGVSSSTTENGQKENDNFFYEVTEGSIYNFSCESKLVVIDKETARSSDKTITASIDKEIEANLPSNLKVVTVGENLYFQCTESGYVFVDMDVDCKDGENLLFSMKSVESVRY